VKKWQINLFSILESISKRIIFICISMGLLSPLNGSAYIFLAVYGSHFITKHNSQFPKKYANK